jgi:hypothetical protein
VSNWGQTEQIRELREALEAVITLNQTLYVERPHRDYEAHLLTLTRMARVALDKDNPTVRE